MEFAKSLWKVGWIGLIVIVIIGSLLPADSQVMRAVNRLPVSDKLQHLAAYAALAFLPTLYERSARLRMILGLTLVLGIVLEFGQIYSPGRTCDMYDMLADSVGVLTGFVVALRVRLLNA